MGRGYRWRRNRWVGDSVSPAEGQEIMEDTSPGKGTGSRAPSNGQQQRCGPLRRVLQAGESQSAALRCGRKGTSAVLSEGEDSVSSVRKGHRCDAGRGTRST